MSGSRAWSQIDNKFGFLVDKFSELVHIARQPSEFMVCTSSENLSTKKPNRFLELTFLTWRALRRKNILCKLAGCTFNVQSANYSSFPGETPELKFRLGCFFFWISFGRKSQSSPHHACATFPVWRMRDFLTNELTGWCNVGRGEAFAAQNQHRHCVWDAQNAYKICSHRSR